MNHSVLSLTLTGKNQKHRVTVSEMIVFHDYESVLVVYDDLKQELANRLWIQGTGGNESQEITHP